MLAVAAYMHGVLLVRRMMTQQDPGIDGACIDAEIAQLEAEVHVQLLPLAAGACRLRTDLVSLQPLRHVMTFVRCHIAAHLLVQVHC